MMLAPNVREMKAREERVRTVLPARIRVGAGWSDVCILNISSGGMMIYGKCTVQPGAQVQLRRGSHFVMARVAWRQNYRIGLASNGPLPVDDIISTQALAPAAVAASDEAVRIELPKRPRDSEHSRYRSRVIQFASIVLAGAALAGMAAIGVEQSLAGPLIAVKAALTPH